MISCLLLFKFDLLDYQSATCGSLPATHNVDIQSEIIADVSGQENKVMVLPTNWLYEVA